MYVRIVPIRTKHPNGRLITCCHNIQGYGEPLVRGMHATLPAACRRARRGQEGFRVVKQHAPPRHTQRRITQIGNSRKHMRCVCVWLLWYNVQRVSLSHVGLRVSDSGLHRGGSGASAGRRTNGRRVSPFFLALFAHLDGAGLGSKGPTPQSALLE